MASDHGPRLPAGLTHRPPTLDDAQAITALTNDAERVDVGEAVVMLSDVQADLATPGFDLALDAVMVHDGEHLAAFGQVSNERADIDVHPDHRGRGIGVALAAWSEDRARSQAESAGRAVARVGQTVAESAAGAGELLAGRGYEQQWESWVLRLPPSVTIEATPPAGVEVRPVRPGEERQAHRIIDAAFSEWEGRDPQTFEQWRATSIDRPDFDPSLLQVAVVDDSPVGAIHAIHYPGEGWVDQVAVDPSHRGRGIATALLATAFAEFRSRGETVLGLNTDSRTGALDLYLRLGMTVDLTFHRWTRELH